MNDDIRNEEELTNAPEDAQPVERQSEGAQEAPEETEKPAGKEGKPKKTVGQEIREWVIALAAAVLIALLIRTFLFTLIRVDGHSMDDTLHNGRAPLRLRARRAPLRRGARRRGHLPLSQPAPPRACSASRRRRTSSSGVRGVPGDVVERKNRVTYINGEAIDPDNAVLSLIYYPNGPSR